MNTVLPILIFAPIVLGFALALTPRGNDKLVRVLALAVATGVFAVSLFACFRFDFTASATNQFVFKYDWLPAFGVSLHLGIDSVSLWLVMLTTFLMPLTVLGSFSAVGERTKEFFLWLLVLEGAMIGVFCAQDLILFYTFFEATLIPMYFLIGIFGSTQKLWASKKFFIFTLTGSLLTFAGLVWVAYLQASVKGNAWTFDIGTLTTFAVTQMTAGQQAWLLAALMAGFAVKVPLFPVHTWLPLAHTEAPTAGSVILAGVLLKLGTYGLLRFALPMAPEAVVTYAPAVAVFAIIGILYTALICWVQQDVKKLVAYSSVSHLGFCILGMFALNATGVSGSVMYMINHGLSTGALFLCIGMVYERYHTRDMDEISGLGKKMPVWATFTVFFCMASVGLPGLNGFVGEFLTLLGAFTSDALGWGYAAVAAIGLILGAIYILYMVGRVCVGPFKVPRKYADQVTDLNLREIAVLTPIAVACLWLGVLPTPMLKSMEQPIKALTGQAQLVLDRERENSNDKAQMANESSPGFGHLNLALEPSAEGAGVTR